tara:strand:+ start:1518 stop:3137 length:1620 start_codon:yes stop_codon:yes gene_type:complete
LNRFNSISIRFKILIIVLIAMLGFSGLLFFDYLVTNENTSRLQKVKDIYFPTLERIDANLVRLDKIKETLNAAVTSAEIDMLEDTDELALKTRTAFDDIAKLDAETTNETHNLSALFDRYYTNAKQLTTGLVNETIKPEKIKSSVVKMRDSLTVYSKALTDFRLAGYERFTSNISDANDASEAALSIGLSVSLFVIVIVALSGFLIGLMIERNVMNVVDALDEIAEGEGDLTQRLDSKGNDEIGKLANSFNRFMSKLQPIIRQVSDSTLELSTSAERMTSISAENKTSSARQHQETELVASAMTEMTATVHEVARNSESAAMSAREANTEASKGQSVVAATIDSINQLANEVEAAADVIQRLEKDCVDIGSIMNVIRGISEQTNLLALNAAIEAARAGEQGRGFAVVADEVRTLASRTQQSTDEIQEMVERLQSGTTQAVNAMAKGRAQAHASVDHVARAGESLSVISNSVTIISEMNAQIATAAEEQTAVAEEINRNIITISDLGHHVTSSSEKAASSSGEISLMSSNLRNLVGRFKV